MTVADNLRSIATEAEPLIEQSLDVAEQIAALRKVAKEKGLDWSQLKAILVAKVRDNKDGGERLKELTEKHDLALTYADMLMKRNVAQHRNTPPQSETRGSSPLGKATAFQAVRDGFDSHGPLQTHASVPGVEAAADPPAASPFSAGEGRKATNATLPSAPLVAAVGDRGDGETAATLDDPYNRIPDFCLRT